MGVPYQDYIPFDPLLPDLTAAVPTEAASEEKTEERERSEEERGSQPQTPEQEPGPQPQTPEPEQQPQPQSPSGSTIEDKQIVPSDIELPSGVEEALPPYGHTVPDLGGEEPAPEPPVPDPPEPMQTLDATQLDPNASVQRAPEPPNVEPARSVGYYDENGVWHEQDEPVGPEPFPTHIEVENERPDTVNVEYQQPPKTIGEYLERHYKPSEAPDGVGIREHLPDHFDLNKNIPPLVEEPAPGPPAPDPGPMLTLDAALLDPDAPGPTLDAALFDAGAPGPTLDSSLFDPTAPGPTLDPALFDPSAPGPNVDPNLLDASAPGETVDPALLDPAAPGPTLDPAQIERGEIVEPSSDVAESAGVTDQVLTEPGLTHAPDHDEPLDLG